MQRATSKPIHVWALALLLLLFQTAMLAHSHDELAQDVDSCEICNHAQQSGDVVFPVLLPVHARVADPGSCFLYCAPVVTGVYSAHSPRAPPLSL
ncbi:hypothetical protein N9235_00045 [Gammaproteobacteria bacterium]|nr:hypothetical protein [Gammaproteobacteria bacterium]